MKKLLQALWVIALSVATIAQTNSPRLTTVTPDTGKSAAEYVTAGENLATSAVKELYLTDGKADIKVEIVSQKAEASQFKVPGSTKAGRYSLMLLTADGKRFLEQPVKLTIE